VSIALTSCVRSRFAEAMAGSRSAGHHLCGNGAGPGHRARQWARSADMERGRRWAPPGSFTISPIRRLPRYQRWRSV